MFFALFTAKAAWADIDINETNFPDENFRNWVLRQPYGQDGVLTDEEIAGIASVDVRDKNIQSLKGIEYFTKLTSLDCSLNLLTALDVSTNIALTTLRCHDNQLTQLDVLKNIALTELFCNYNQLTSLDVSKNTALKELYCNDNQLTVLDVSKNNELKRLLCSNNQLAKLELKSLPKLEDLNCIQNRLEKIIVSDCPELWTISCYNNCIKGEAIDELVAGLPVIPEEWGHLCVVNIENEQNVMTKTQVAAARAKGWSPCYKYGTFGKYGCPDYEGIDDSIEPVTYTQDQMATIILPTAPDAEKGKYYRLNRVEGKQIVFEQELLPRARVPYIIVPSEDFSIDINDMDLKGLQADTVSVEGVSFIGTFHSKEIECPEGFYIDLIDKTPLCTPLPGEGQEMRLFVGALRAYLLLPWEDPFHPGGTKGPADEMEIVLRDNPNSLQMVNDKSSNGKYFDLQGRRLSGKPAQGVYIEDGQKKLRGAR